jgi:hypothetical protein
MKKYTVRILTYDFHREVELDQSRFDELQQAQQCLHEAYAIEVKYEILRLNYLDLEKECLNITSDYILRDYNSQIDTSHKFGCDIHLAFNRRMINLLTSTKLYCDQIKGHIRKIIPNDQVTVDSIFLAESKKHYEFRFMEKLRNHVQHAGLATHSVSINSRLTSERKQEYKISIFSHKTELERNRNGNRDTSYKQVLNDMPEKVELMNFSRVYVESINKIHCDIRQLLVQKVEEFRQLIEKQIEECKSLNYSSSQELRAVCNQDLEVIDIVPLVLESDDFRKELAIKNKRLIDLTKKYVSSSV